MVSKRAFYSRVALGLVTLVAMAAIVGCSTTSSPSGPLADTTNRVAGTLRSDEGEPVAEISVWLGAKIGAEGADVVYQTETDQYGQYEIEDIQMANELSTETTYSIYANRTPSRTSAVNADYETWESTVAVPCDDCATLDIELEYVGGYDPETYIDD